MNHKFEMKKYRWSVSCFLMATFDLLIPGKIFRETTHKKINTYSSQLFFTKSLFRLKKTTVCCMFLMSYRQCCRYITADLSR